MELEHLALEAFGRYTGCHIDFGPGLNLILGPNEAGKSTLSMAILKCLFCRSTQKKAMARWRPWQLAHGPAAALQFRNDQAACVRIERNWEAGKAELYLNGQRDTRREAAWHRLVPAWAGVHTETEFAGTVFVAQDQFESTLLGTASLNDTIERIALTGHRVQVQDILKRMDRARGRLRRGMLRRVDEPGPIAALDEELASISQQLELYQSRKARHDRASGQFQDTYVQHRELCTERAQVQADISLLERAQTLADRAEALAAELEEVNRTRSFYHEQESRIGALEARLAALDPIRAIAPERMAALETLRVPVATPSGTGQENSPGIWRWLIPMCFAAGVASIVWAAATDQTLLWTLGGVWALLGAVLGVWRMTIRENQRRHVARDGGDRALAEQLAAYGCDSWAQFQAAVEEVRSITREIPHLRDLQQAYLGEGRSIGALILQATDLERDLAQVRTDLDGPVMQAALAMAPQAVQTLYQRQAQLGRDVPELEARLRVLEGELNVLQGDTTTVLAMEERLHALRQQRDRLWTRVEVLELTGAELARARNQALAAVLQQLAPAIGFWLDRLTHGRYPEVQLDASRHLTVSDDAHRQGRVAPALLSAGTQDQVYFATRLALMDLLFPKIRPPLFLDDPFVKFDADRHQAAVGLLREIAQDRQVLLFSHSPAYVPVADHVIDLSAGQVP